MAVEWHPSVAMLNPTVPTATQEREERGERTGSFFVGCSWKGKGTHIWRLKQEKPELFELKSKATEKWLAQNAEIRPPGFESCSMEGWLYCKEQNIYMKKTTGQRFWLDEVDQIHRPLWEGESLPVTFAGAAATFPAPCSAPSVPASSSSGPSTKRQAKPTSAPKTVLISDLHLAAKALKIQLGHFDRPAGVLAIVGGSTSVTAAVAGAGAGTNADAGGAPPQPDMVARLLPEKLLRRLAAFRGEWSDERLREAASGALLDVAAAFGGAALPVAAFVLVLGLRAVAVAAPGAQFTILPAPVGANPGNAGGAVAAAPTASAVCRVRLASGAPATGESLATALLTLQDPSESFLMSLAVGRELDLTRRLAKDPLVEAAPTGKDGDARPADARHLALAASPHIPFVAQGRPRAASIALLREGRRGCHSAGPLVAACARLGTRVEAESSAATATAGSGVGGAAGNIASSEVGGPAAKRQRTQQAEEHSSQVRLRQVLLRHASSSQPKDPVRSRPVKRTLEEAEEQMLGILESLLADGCASFASMCKAVSECQSALKGGELAGDLGWLDRKNDDKQRSKREALRVHVPANVLRAAFELAVGELGDIVTSELGVHLVQRTA